MVIATLLGSDAWLLVKDGDDRARALYLRHYSADKRSKAARYGSRARAAELFVGPGEKMVMLTPRADAVLAWRKAGIRDDDQVGVECTIFRNEGTWLSSALIEEACELAWAKWPQHRLFTFVDPRRVRSTNPGYCFLMAGFRRCGRSKRRGLHILERLP